MYVNCVLSIIRIGALYYYVIRNDGWSLCIHFENSVFANHLQSSSIWYSLSIWDGCYLTCNQNTNHIAKQWSFHRFIIKLNFAFIFLVIFQNSTNDSLAQPWRIDPCQLEEQQQHTAGGDLVRLLSGRLKILWNHSGNAPNYRLIVTELMKGSNCNHSGQHACLRVE